MVVVVEATVEDTPMVDWLVVGRLAGWVAGALVGAWVGTSVTVELLVGA